MKKKTLYSLSLKKKFKIFKVKILILQENNFSYWVNFKIQYVVCLLNFSLLLQFWIIATILNSLFLFIQNKYIIVCWKKKKYIIVLLWKMCFICFVFCQFDSVVISCPIKNSSDFLSNWGQLDLKWENIVVADSKFIILESPHRIQNKSAIWSYFGIEVQQGNGNKKFVYWQDM